MNTRAAILGAADHIEANPGDLNFVVCSIWRSKGSQAACPLVWIGRLAGWTTGLACEVALELVPEKRGRGELGPACAEGEFFNRMFKLAGTEEWTCSSTVCAKTLRAYADKYHPEVMRLAA